MRDFNDGKFGGAFARGAFARGRLAPYAVSAGLVGLTFIARWALAPWLEQRGPLLPFIAAVVLAAGLYGVGAGLLAIGLSVAIATWAFILPGGAGFSPDQVTSIAVFVVTSVA